ncbi:hypothetical protein CHGG_08247 [Chaetomium globosum CBS 148.51]|uniref:non-specific serine/threonine protein kinase n=1 Tax=Chaetomium globosum (strain ATCC 6205 / CBS 148.51 / DSM 1962 / NBRC 6347 / NRRL 1970) TaxID=306901 RepID=Q2GUV7_CHAGB|nr:uncharacterized protein CHGG_08247 [Chaetomium globosum CBS 148.51]EAQ86994.1 hypothetical protein CHGG_08247 [Chaetomium globosum CBS 148.51]
MNGDISLSQALGGLRIANPDDSPNLSQDTSTSHDDDHTTQAGNRTEFEETSGPNALQNAESQPGPRDTPPRQPHTYESAAAILKNAQNNLNATRGIPGSTGSSDPHLPSQYGSYQLANEGQPPASALLPSQGRGAEQEVQGDPYGAPRNEQARSSVYGMRSDPSPVGGGGGGGGVATIPGIPQAPAGSYGPEMPLPASSEEWKDRGAAVSLKREVDAEGKTVVRSVKKGVRDFSFGRTLGEGSYSTVFLATDRQTLREYAVKVLEKKHIIKEKKIKYVNIEKNTLNRLTDHPGIVRLYYTFQDEASLYYVLDLCNGGELLGVLKKTGTFDVECTRFYGAQILDAIAYMHSRGVIHRDLKPENVLMDDQMHIKITDFGTAKLCFPPAARDLVERCLVLDPTRRLTVDHIKNHEFFDGQQFGKELWRTKAPRLRPYVPPAQEPHIIQLNGTGGSSPPKPNSRGAHGPPNGSRPAQDYHGTTTADTIGHRMVAGPDEKQRADIEAWRPDGNIITHPKHTTKKRQRLVMITSGGRIVLAPAGGEEKRAKQEISLLGSDCVWKTQLDAKGQAVWCVDTNGVHYTFEEPKASQNSEAKFSVDDWIESLERAKDLAISQTLAGPYNSDNGFGDMSSSMSSPESTMGGRTNFTEGYSISDRSGRNQLSKSQASLEEVNVKRNRFSKRQSKNGLGAAF